MVVTQLEEIEKSKIKVYLDEEFAFILYQKDIDQYGISEGLVLSQELYQRIMEDTIYRRAKQKALAILKFMDRSEQELRKKLNETGYPADIIEQTIHYVSEYGYLNDERFGAAYIRSRMHTKSKLAIKTELLQKGLDKSLITQLFESAYNDEDLEDAELVAIKKAIAKKTKSLEELNQEEKQKLIASLYRKGFDFSKIRQIIY